jgi:phage shock protein C
MRLMRSRSDRMIAGVCGGLGHYFGVDPVIVRLIFLVSTILAIVPLILYPILWLIMPEEDRSAMHVSTLPPDARFDPMTGEPLQQNQPAIGQTVSLKEAPAGTGTAAPGNRNRTLGTVLLIVGGLILINNISDTLMWLLGIDIASMMFPLLLVGVGIYLLRRKGA